MREPHWLFIMDKIEGRVRERFTSPLVPILSIKIEKTLPKPPLRLTEAKLCSSTRETKIAVKVNARDRAVILMELNPDLDAKMAYFLALYDEYDYYHQLRNKDRLLYRAGKLNNYSEIDI